MPTKIMRVELPEDVYSLHCPFCGRCVSRLAESGKSPIEPGDSVCRHLLFAASDYGFDYAAKRYNSLMRKRDLTDEAIDNVDRFTNRGFPINGAVKFAIYQDVGGWFGSYFGFAPESHTAKEIGKAQVDE